MLKIVLTIGSLDLGGAEKQLRLLAKEFRNMGHQVQIITVSKVMCMGHKTRFPDFDYLNKIGDERVRSGSKLKKILVALEFVINLYRYLIFQKPDIVYAWLPHAYILSMPTAFFARVPVRISARRGMWDACEKKHMLIGSRISNIFATHFIANCLAVSRDAVWKEKIPEGRVHVIENIVEFQASRANVRIQPTRAVVVANMIHYKGHQDLLAAISLSKTDTKFLLVGDGPLREKIQKLTIDLGLSTKVEFLGVHARVIDVMLNCQFGVLPSHTEGLPNFILEAYSIGLPIIATNVGGVSEVVQDGFNGLLVEAKSPQELAQAMSLMSQDSMLRQKLSNHAVLSINNYRVERIVSKYMDFFSSIDSLQSKIYRS